MSLLMILPRDKKIPEDYSLIKITNATKDFFTNLKTNESHYLLKVEAYESEDPLNIYLDVPFEKKRIHKFIVENLIKNDSYRAKSFQAPISSSPFVKGFGGGISLSSISEKSPFSETFLTTLKLMQPPEFTNLSKSFPDSITRGKKINSLTKGVSFLVGEKFFMERNHFSCFTSQNNEKLLSELNKKKKFNGEYSITCSLTSISETASQKLRETLSKFVKTDISNTLKIEDIKYDEDINLFDVRNQITEDLWIQIANQRENTPKINQDINELSWRKKLIVDWLAIMESLNLKKPSNSEATLYAQKTFENIKRVAQSIARDNQVKKVDAFILNDSYKLFIKNSEALILDPKTKRDIKGIELENKNKKLEMIQIALTIKALTLNELFEEIGYLFDKNLLKLQEMLDALKISGNIYEPKNGYYKWI